MDAVTIEAYNRLANPWKSLVYLNATQAMVANTPAIVKFDTVVFDPASMFTNSGTTTAGWTIQKTGIYLVGGIIGVSINPASTYNQNAGVVTGGVATNVVQYLLGTSPVMAVAFTENNGGATMFKFTAGTLVGIETSLTVNCNLHNGSSTCYAYICFLSPA